MEKGIAKDLDRVLNYLDSKNGQLFEILDELGIDKKNKELLLKELESKGLIRANRSNSGNHLLFIEPDGKAFIQSGQSFGGELSQQNMLAKRNSNANMIDNISKIAGIISLFLGIVLGYLNYSQNQSINDLSAKIEALQKEINIVKLTTKTFGN